MLAALQRIDSRLKRGQKPDPNRATARQCRRDPSEEERVGKSAVPTARHLSVDCRSSPPKSRAKTPPNQSNSGDDRAIQAEAQPGSRRRFGVAPWRGSLRQSLRGKQFHRAEDDDVTAKSVISRPGPASWLHGAGFGSVLAASLRPTARDALGKPAWAASQNSPANAELPEESPAARRETHCVGGIIAVWLTIRTASQ
jgi:hypothetical protein